MTMAGEHGDEPRCEPAGGRGAVAPTLYAGSGDAASLFTHPGWHAIERVSCCGPPLLILRRAVALSPR
jgi:hypothetical protein